MQLQEARRCSGAGRRVGGFFNVALLQFDRVISRMAGSIIRGMLSSWVVRGVSVAISGLARCCTSVLVY